MNPSILSKFTFLSILSRHFPGYFDFSLSSDKVSKIFVAKAPWTWSKWPPRMKLHCLVLCKDDQVPPNPPNGLLYKTVYTCISSSSVRRYANPSVQGKEWYRNNGLIILPSVFHENCPLWLSHIFLHCPIWLNIPGMKMIRLGSVKRYWIIRVGSSCGRQKVV